MKQLRFRPPPQTHYPLSPPRPIGATLGTAMNNFNSSHKKVFEYYITWLFYFWIWRRCYLVLLLDLKKMLHGFGPWEPWGPTFTIWTTLNPRPLRIDSCQVWLKSDQAFSRSRWNSYFLHRAPSPTCYPPPPPPTGAHWGHPGNCHEQLLFFT